MFSWLLKPPQGSYESGVGGLRHCFGRLRHDRILGMKEWLKGLPWFLAAVVVLSTIGYLVERWRRREVERWAATQGGTFEGGGILDEVVIPEAAPFDANAGDDRITYNHVTRIVRPEATYTLAQYYHQWKDVKNTQRSSTCVVCFVTLPAGDWPQVRVFRPLSDPLGIRDMLQQTSPVKVPGAQSAFAAAFEVHPLLGTPAPNPEALAKLLPSAVQTELLATESLIGSLLVRGRVIRIQAVDQLTGYPHPQVFEVARRLTTAWSADR